MTDCEGHRCSEQELRTLDPLGKLDPQMHCEFYVPGWPRGQTVPTNLFLPGTQCTVVRIVRQR